MSNTRKAPEPFSPLSELVPDIRNVNKHTQRGTALLEDSLRKHGAGRSILIDRNNKVIAGNATLEGAASIGLEDVQIIESDGRRLIAVKRTDIDLETPEGRELALLDNRTSEVNLEWDVEVLAQFKYEGVDLSGLWNDDELEELLESGGGGGITGDPDEIPENVETRCKPGDLWKLGEHRLGCFDCTVRGNVERLLGGIEPDMVFADPPYGIAIVAANGYVGGGEAYDIPFGGVKNKKRGDVGGTAAHMRKTGKTYMEQKGLGSANGAKPFGSKRIRGSVGAANIIDVGKYLPVQGDETTDTAIRSVSLFLEMFPKAFHVWWGANYYANILPPSARWLTWDKENTGNFADVEMAWTNQNKAARLFRHMWNGMLRASEHERRIHPTQKPVALAEWAIKLEEGVKSLCDPFAGSGMSLMACEAAGCTWFGIECEPVYMDLILQRWENATGKQAELVEHGCLG